MEVREGAGVGGVFEGRYRWWRKDFGRCHEGENGRLLRYGREVERKVSMTVPLGASSFSSGESRYNRNA